MSDPPPTELPALPAHPRLSEEFKLLVACSWMPPDALEREQGVGISSLCKAGVDWKEFLRLVRRHGIPVLAHAALRRHAGGSCPAEVREILKQWQLRSRVRALKHGAELGRLHALFGDRGIEVMPLKGLLLSLQLYGTPWMRHAADLDLLVRPRDVERADRLLREDGYLPKHLGESPTPRQKEHLRTSIDHYEYADPGTGIRLELHCRGSMCGEEHSAAMWHLPRTVTWNGAQYTLPNRDRQLLYLCEHGARHKWFRLKWVSDVAMLLARGRSTDWERLLESAERFGSQRILAHSALLAAWLYGVEPAEPVRRLIRRENRCVDLTAAAVRALLTERGVEAEAIGTPFTGFRRLRLMKRLRPSFSYRAVWKEVLISHHDFRPFPLPDRLFWLYVPLRPLFWALRHTTRESQGGNHDGHF